MTDTARNIIAGVFLAGYAQMTLGEADEEMRAEFLAHADHAIWVLQQSGYQIVESTNRE